MSKKILAIVLAACMMLSLVAVLSGCNKIDKKSVQNDPNAQVLSSLEKTMDAFKNSNGSSPLAWLATTTQKGAITFETETDEIGKISNTLYMNKGENKYVDKLLITKGEDKTRFDLYANKEELVVSAPGFLGEGAYGIDLKNIYNDLKASGVWDATGITYEEFDKMFGSIFHDVQSESNGQQSASMKEMLEMWNKIKAITNQCSVTVDDQSIITITDMAKSVNVTYTLTTDQLKQIVDIVMEWVGKNNNLSDFGFLNIDMFDEAEEGEPSDESKPVEKTEIEKLATEIKKALDDSRTIIKLTFSINPKTEMMMKVVAEVNANVDEYNESFRISLDLGKDVATSTAYKFRISKTNGANKAESVFAVNYERMDAKGIYDRRITVLFEDDQNEAEYAMRFAWIMSDMSYTATIDWDGDDIVAGGFCKVENNVMDITVTSLRYEKEDIDLDFRLLIEPNKETPQTPEYTNILKMSKEDLEALLDKLGVEDPDIPDIPDIPDVPVIPDDPIDPVKTLVKFHVIDYNGGEFTEDMSIDGNTLYDLLSEQNVVIMNDTADGIVGVYEGLPSTSGSWAVTINGEEISGNYREVELSDDDVVEVKFVPVVDIPDEPSEPMPPYIPEDPAQPSDPIEPSEPIDPPEPTDPAEPTDPVDPTDPADPVTPADPVE